MRIDDKERERGEDFSHENGKYSNYCLTCKELFTGHKRRLVCKLCARLMQKSRDLWRLFAKVDAASQPSAEVALVRNTMRSSTDTTEPPPLYTRD